MPAPAGTPRGRAQTERLLNLLIALRATRGWMDRATLRAAIKDYQEQPDDKAFDRMFSRDKALLRDLGITIRTTESTDEWTGDKHYGYRIDDEDYALPPVSINAEEYAMLAAATELLRTSAVASKAVTGIHKLRARSEPLSDSPDHAAEPVPAVALDRLDTVYAELTTFITGHTPIHFAYRKPGCAPQQRRVFGMRLLTRGNRIYLIGYDYDRGELRSYRLSRIVGRITRAKGVSADDVPEGITIDTDLQRFDDTVASPGTAILEIAEGRGLPLRRRGTPCGDRQWAVPYTDVHLFAEELLAYGSHVQPREPAELCAAHRRLAVDTLARLSALERHTDV